MKNSSTFIFAIIFILIVWVFLGSCSPKQCPTYADSSTEVYSEYDTIISVSNDTTYYRRPYKLQPLEKVGFVVAAGFVFWAIDWHREHNKDP